MDDGRRADRSVTVAVRWLTARYVLGTSLHTADVSYGFLLATAVLGAAAYYLPVMQRTNGKTLGKAMLGIRVVRINGEPISFRLVTLREVIIQVGIIGGLASLPNPMRTVGIICGLLDYCWPLWDGEKRALHDIVVNTRVVDYRHDPVRLEMGSA
ncbi:MAG TPA: RDD family protein [Solirubrobacteraceae bacterium]|nr:RDD family protein [Solirubrobacteraceae bacterium]